MTLFDVPGCDTVHSVDANHIGAWNQIASDPGILQELSLRVYHDQTPLAAANAHRDSDWRAAVRGMTAQRRELVVVDTKAR